MSNTTEPTQHQQRFTVEAVKGLVMDIHHTQDPSSPAAWHIQHQHHAGPVRQTQPSGADIFACCVIGCRSPPEKDTQSHSPMSLRPSRSTAAHPLNRIILQPFLVSLFPRRTRQTASVYSSSGQQVPSQPATCYSPNTRKKAVND